MQSKLNKVIVSTLCRSCAEQLVALKCTHFSDPHIATCSECRISGLAKCPHMRMVRRGMKRLCKECKKKEMVNVLILIMNEH